MIFNDQTIERVQHITYLVIIINENWDISQEIKTQIPRATAAFNKINKFFYE